MATIGVSIDAQGNITCPDESLRAGDPVSWSVSGGTITSIVPGSPSPFSSNPTVSRGQWSATVIGSGTYTITDAQGKQKTPKITVLTPMAETEKSY